MLEIWLVGGGIIRNDYGTEKMCKEDYESLYKLLSGLEYRDAQPNPVINEVRRAPVSLYKLLQERKICAMCAKRLERQNINTLEDVAEYSRSELKKIRYFGEKCMLEIMEVMEEYGYEFKGNKCIISD